MSERACTRYQVVGAEFDHLVEISILGSSQGGFEGEPNVGRPVMRTYGSFD
jgi:hypothetical protein